MSSGAAPEISTLLILSAMLQSGAVRLKVETGSKVCQIKESDDSTFKYGINFDLNVGECSDTLNCNFFHFKSDLVKAFIEPPQRIPPTGRLARCPCQLKPIGEEEARSMQDVKDTDEDILVDFVASDREPCTEEWCWTKYNQFVYLDQGSKGGNFSFDANHWDIKCVEGKASLAGLKSFTVKQVYQKAGADQQAKMQETSKGIFLPPSADGKVAAIMEPKNLSTGQGTAKAGTTLDESIIENYFGSDALKTTASKNLSTGQGTAKAGTTLDESIIENYFSSNGVKTTASKVSAGTSGAESNGSIGSDSSMSGAPNSNHQFTKDALNSVQQVIENYQLVEAKLALMVNNAEAYKKACASMKDGQQAETLYDEAEIGFSVIQNLNVLIKILGGNLDPMTAFYAASQTTAVDEASLQQLLEELMAAMDLQSDIIARMSNLTTEVLQSLEDFKAHDGQNAHTLAEDIVKQLEILLAFLKEHRLRLKTALIAVEFVD
mmetsp:Transcript_117965/g.217053  ORF Transcript_117965/g.217053 Transcript_117965/m.217053 type:complete len:492 (-) Transcript_117965:104-1579(-)